MPEQGCYDPKKESGMAVRVSLFLRVLISAVLGLGGCAEPLRTDRPTMMLYPAPLLPEDQLGVVTPTPEGADGIRSFSSGIPTVLTQTTATTSTTDMSTPAQEAQLLTTPLTTTVVLDSTADQDRSPIITIVPPTLPSLTPEQRWRMQQADRLVFETLQTYVARAQTKLWWYDPINQQHVLLGTFSGPFLAQARFHLPAQANAEALEVPYHINQQYGLTALSPALVERMRAAGYTTWVETYVLVSSEVEPLNTS